ncbi:MAG: alpha/beta fold hydrolase [Acetobacteraceae bacterium]|nr:alpha/beta fold hydrolase [Acetobacteraceae bacterium]
MDQSVRVQNPPSLGGMGSFLFGPFRLNLIERSLRRQGAPVRLGARAFDILALLVQRAGRVVGHDELVGHVWQGMRVSPGTPRVHLAALRQVLGCRPDSTRYIANIPGRGYCFVAPVEAAGVVNGHGAAGNPRPVAGHSEEAGASAGQFRAERGPRTDHLLSMIAKQLLATPSTAHTLVSTMFGTHRELGAAFGDLDGREASMTKASPAATQARPDSEGEGQEMTRKRLALAAAITLLTCVAEATPIAAPAQSPAYAAGNVTHYRTANVEGVDLFYREAGSGNAPVVVLLHGFPTSSHMFRNLIPVLADRYRVIAPDYPGFGQSAAPEHTKFAYTFAHYAVLVDALLQKLGATRYAMYVMDYGAPVGYRLALLHPDRVTALIVQNGNAYAEGLGAFWDPIKAYWADDSDARRRKLEFLVAPATTRFQYVDGVSDISRISPDNWVQDQALLDRPGNRDIQLDLFRDYGTNVPLYPDFQAFFRKYQPPTLIVWGKNDKIFPAEGADPYLRDLPKAEFHMLDTGHFALEDKLDVMAPLISNFLHRSLPPN